MQKNRNSSSPGRVAIFCGAVLSLFLVMGLRLVDLQLWRGTAFATQADANRFFTARVPAERGVILDRFGESLVQNTPTYFQLDNPSALYSGKTAITPDIALSLMTSDSAHVATVLERQYKFAEATAHVLGYTGAVTSDDLVNENLLHPDDTIGKLGLEKTFDRQLRGQSGKKVYEVNALGKRQRVVEEVAAVPGQNLASTIDPYLSQKTYELLGDKRGAVVIMDAQTGELLTLVSTPSFNNTLLSKTFVDETQEQQRRQSVQDFFTDPNKLFFNRAVSGSYPPGSVFKLITALAGLEYGAFDETTTVRDEGVLRVGEFTYANWFYTQYGRAEGDISVQRALARSNDIFFYKAAEWIGPTKLAEMSRLFGLGKPTGVELSPEAAGLVPDPAWKEQTIGERWFLGNTYHFGIGQADLLVSPLQITQMTQAFANHGTVCQPTLVKDEKTADCHEVGVSEEHLKTVLKGMLDACSPGGTAFPFFPHNGAVRTGEGDPFAELDQQAVACKTGTAEFGGVDENGYRSTHGWFTAIVEVGDLQRQFLENPNEATNSGELRNQWQTQVKEKGFPKRLVMVALVESDETQKYREGSSDAAPVIKDLVDWMRGEEVPEEVSEEERVLGE